MSEGQLPGAARTAAGPALNMASPIAGVLIHVADVNEGLAWYQRAFPQARRVRLEEFDFELLEIGPVRIEMVPADEKCPSGSAGSVVYWRVEELRQAIAHLQQLGAALYRGPIAIEDGLGMCQVRDPWGNCIGLRGLWAGELPAPGA